MPEFTGESSRAVLLAYHLGHLAWEQGDYLSAVSFWKEADGVVQYLIFQGQQVQSEDVDAATQWYEAAILTASTDQTLAETLWAYTDGMRGKVETKVFNERLAALSTYFGPETTLGHRLEGQRLMESGDLKAALEELSKAVDMGFTDSETWHLLGYTAWNLDGLEMAEYAFRQSLDAPVQIPGRHAWYLYQMASLLASEGRPEEALIFQEEAARSNNYYLYHDALAVLYARLGQLEKARQTCLKARELSGQDIIVLLCEDKGVK